MLLVWLVLGILVLGIILNQFYFDYEDVEELPGRYTLTYKEKAMELKKQYRGNKYRLNIRRGYIQKRVIKFGRAGFDMDRQWWLNMLLTMMLIIAVMIFTLLAILKIGHEVKAMQKQNEYTIIVKQVERLQDYDEDFIVNGDIGSLSNVYQEVEEYNNWVIKNQYWVSNKWVGWFYNKHAEDLEVIDLSEYNLDD